MRTKERGIAKQNQCLQINKIEMQHLQEAENEAKLRDQVTCAAARGGKYIIKDIDAHFKMKAFMKNRMLELAQFLADSEPATSKDINNLVDRDSKLPKTMRRASLIKPMTAVTQPAGNRPKMQRRTITII